MNIAIIGNRGECSMERSLADAFGALGHSSQVFDIYDTWIMHTRAKRYAVPADQFARKALPGYDRRSWLRLARKVEAAQPDLVVAIDRRIHPDFVAALKKPARRIIHVNPDSMLTLGAQQVLASDYDAWLVKDAYMQRFMHDGAGLRTFLYHEAVDLKLCPKPDEPKAAAEERLDIDVMTYGTIYPYRARILTEVARAGFNLKLYGTAPLRFFDGGLRKAYTGEYIVGQRRAEVIYGARIAFNTLHYAEVEAVNARFFQINGSGGFQLCDYRPALKELLPVDPELVSYKNTGECVEKIRHYLAHPQERYDLAEKIHRHALAHYGFDRLAEHILDIVGKL